MSILAIHSYRQQDKLINIYINWFILLSIAYMYEWQGWTLKKLGQPFQVLVSHNKTGPIFGITCFSF